MGGASRRVTKPGGRKLACLPNDLNPNDLNPNDFIKTNNVVFVYVFTGLTLVPKLDAPIYIYIYIYIYICALGLPDVSSQLY